MSRRDTTRVGTRPKDQANSGCLGIDQGRREAVFVLVVVLVRLWVRVCVEVPVGRRVAVGVGISVGIGIGIADPACALGPTKTMVMSTWKRTWLCLQTGAIPTMRRAHAVGVTGLVGAVGLG